MIFDIPCFTLTFDVIQNTFISFRAYRLGACNCKTIWFENLGNVILFFCLDRLVGINDRFHIICVVFLLCRFLHGEFLRFWGSCFGFLDEFTFTFNLLFLEHVCKIIFLILNGFDVPFNVRSDKNVNSFVLDISLRGNDVSDILLEHELLQGDILHLSDESVLGVEKTISRIIGSCSAIDDDISCHWDSAKEICIVNLNVDSCKRTLNNMIYLDVKFIIHWLEIAISDNTHVLFFGFFIENSWRLSYAVSGHGRQRRISSLSEGRDRLLDLLNLLSLTLLAQWRILFRLILITLLLSLLVSRNPCAIVADAAIIVAASFETIILVGTVVLVGIVRALLVLGWHLKKKDQTKGKLIGCFGDDCCRCFYVLCWIY